MHRVALIVSSVDRSGAAIVLLNYYEIIIKIIGSANCKIFFLNPKPLSTVLLSELERRFVTYEHCQNSVELYKKRKKFKPSIDICFTQKEIKHIDIITFFQKSKRYVLIQNDEPSKIRKCFLSLILALRFDLVLFISKRTLQLWKPVYGKVIENFISDVSIQKTDKTCDLFSAKKRICFYGRIAYQKGVDILLGALLKYMDVFHDYKGLSLLIVGELENEIYAKRILDQIGRLEDLGVPILKKFENLPHLQIINDYDVLVTPSRFEGGDFTLVMMESLMAGKLVITGILPAQTKLPFVKYYNFSGDNLIQDIEKFLLEHEDEVEDQIRYFTALNKRNRDDAFIQIKQLLAGNAI